MNLQQFLSILPCIEGQAVLSWMNCRCGLNILFSVYLTKIVWLQTLKAKIIKNSCKGKAIVIFIARGGLISYE